MSKMSQLHAELTQEAYDLGFDSLEDALNHGYVPEYEGGKLVPTEEIMKQSHEEWLKEKDEVFKGLRETWFYLSNLGHKEEAEKVARAMQFIQKGEM